MKRLLGLTLLVITASFRPDLTAASKYSPLPAEYDGSMMPIDLTRCDTTSGVPDSLRAVHISYIARHGARFLSSAKKISSVEKRLYEAAVNGKLSPEGASFFSLLKDISKATDGRWGLLSPVGIYEEEFLGDEMGRLYPQLLHKGEARSISTFVPRVIMTMYEFNHSLEQHHNKLELYTASGHQNDSLLYFFDYYPEYKEYRDSGEWTVIYEDFVRKHVSPEPARRLFALEYDNNSSRLRNLTMDIYGVLQGCRAAGLDAPTTRWMSSEEYRGCWLASNLKHYLRNTPNSTDPFCIPATAPLVKRIIADADHALAQPAENNQEDKKLRFSGYFGHAETLLPLFSVIQLPGCYATVDNYDDLDKVWKLQDIVPLGANMAIIFMKPKSTGNPDRIYVSVRLNGQFIEPLPGKGKIVDWNSLKENWLEKIESQN